MTALLDATTRENQKVKQQTNQSSDAVFAQEQKHLLPYRVPLDTYLTSTYKVNKYSLIHVDFNSVPDYLVGKEVTVRKNIQQIKVYYQVAFYSRQTLNWTSSISYRYSSLFSDIKKEACGNCA